MNHYKGNFLYDTTEVAILSSLKIFSSGICNRHEAGNDAWRVLTHTFELLLFPNVMWAMCLNGLTLGMDVAIGTTYGNILHAAPYNWPNSSISYVVGVFTAVLYGQGAADPGKYHWFLYARVLAAYYFCFLGANIVAITYLLDSYPVRAGPLLVIIAPFIENAGYDGAFGAFGGLTALFGLLGLPVFWYGKSIRRVTGRYVKDTTTK
ncbi:hypothetical protein KVT40_001285 [Elsinoe batatas]|uniref:Uncharacterized protein n=1 Tax=Elsinoe batatas TaxID=2601811 RepID=A0A8K0PH69_9PEZI|nr:hypothetical protein KVT40_001285 [Elsinoe batatas]